MGQLFKKPFFSNEFTKNIVTLTTGTSIAQFFPLLFYPVLGRIFIPSDFGLLATLTSITTIIAIIASGKYESSILITESKEEGANVIGLILTISFGLLFFMFLILQLFSHYLSEWFNEPNLSRWLFVCPLSAYVIIIYNCFNEWCVQNKYFKILSWNKIVNAASTTFGKLFFGIIKIFGNGLIVGDLIGRSFSAGTCIYRALKNDKDVFYNISTKQYKPIAKKYIEFPKYTMSDQLLNSAGIALPIFLIGAFFNNIEVGYYSMTMNVLSVPISVISVAVRDVFRQRANEDFIKNGNCLYIFKRLLKTSSLTGLIIAVPLFFILPNVFSIVLGKQWEIAGVYSQILLPMILLSFVSMSLSGVLIITRKMKISMYWQICFVALTVFSLLIGFFVFKTIKATLICFTIGRVIAYIIYIMISYKFSKGN